MKPRSSTKGHDAPACRCLAAFIAILLVGSLIALAGEGIRNGGIPYGGASGSPTSPEGLVFQLGGPNDGEPINARSMELRLSTNYRELGSVSVYVNDRYVSSRSLVAGAVRDGASGLLVSTIHVSLEDVLASIEHKDVRSSTTELRVRVYLYSVLSSRLVTYDEWKGRLERPWMEFPTRDGALVGVSLPPGKVPVVLHLLPGDSYYFVLTSPREEILALSPQNPTALREAVIVSGSSCRVDATPGRGQRLIYVDAYSGAGARPLLVLWTYDPTRGWKRSAIAEIPSH